MTNGALACASAAAPWFLACLRFADAVVSFLFQLAGCARSCALKVLCSCERGRERAQPALDFLSLSTNSFRLTTRARALFLTCCPISSGDCIFFEAQHVKSQK